MTFKDLRVPIGLMCVCAAVIWFSNGNRERAIARAHPPAAPVAVAQTPPPSPAVQTGAQGVQGPAGDAQARERRASAGDARAAFYLSQIGLRCETQQALVARIGGAVDDACAGYKSERTWKQWHDLAIAAGDPLAQFQDAVLERLTHGGSQEAIDAAIAAAVASGDSQVLTAVGFAMFNPAIHDDPVDALAYLLVGCADCSTDDPSIGFGCAAVGACAYGGTLEDWIRETFPEQYPEATLRADALARMLLR